MQTGVTVVLPACRATCSCSSCRRGVACINGFGKSVGLMQVRGARRARDADRADQHLLGAGRGRTRRSATASRTNPEFGRSLPTLNPLVFECNDGLLNDMQRMAVREAPCTCRPGPRPAKRSAQGAVGAGRGMSCFGLKGGIGSASRCVRRRAAGYTAGRAGARNYGLLPNLVMAGRAVGARLARSCRRGAAGRAREGLDHHAARHRRAARRAPAAPPGAARRRRPGAHRLGLRPRQRRHRAGLLDRLHACRSGASEPMPAVALLHDALLDGLFQAAADSDRAGHPACAVGGAESVTGRDGHVRPALTELLRDWPADAFAPTTCMTAPMKILISVDIEGVAGVFHSRAGARRQSRVRARAPAG